LDQTKSSPAAGNGRLFPLSYKRIVSYAAAATIGGVLVAAAILFTDSRPNRLPLQPNITASAQESSISSHTVLAPENEVYREITKKMQGVSDEEINLYLEETASTETIEWMPEEMN
jgi:cytoskeletal protein RodZ